VAFDRAGNFTPDLGTYAPLVKPVPLPGQLTAPAPTAGEESATLTWESTDPSITGYGVQVYRSTATGDVADGALKETTAKTLTVTGLTAGATYTFTVKAQNSAGYGPESAKSTPVKPTAVTDRLTITSARWKTGDFRVVGTGTVPGSVVTVHRVNADGSIGTAITGATANVAAPVAPSTVGAYDAPRSHRGSDDQPGPRVREVEQGRGRRPLRGGERLTANPAPPAGPGPPLEAAGPARRCACCTGPVLAGLGQCSLYRASCTAHRRW